MAQKLATFVSLVKLRSAIDAATSQSDDPPGVHALTEIVRMVGSNAESVNAAVEAIQQRLSNRSPVVKQKALRLIKHAAQHGSPELRRALTQRSYSIRELTSFRCAPDPLKGDAPWKHVQQAANDALQALHAPPDAHQPQTTLTNRIEGFGGQGSRSGLAGGFGPESGLTTSSGGGRTMVGFGSSASPPASGYQSQQRYSGSGGPLYGNSGVGSSSSSSMLDSISYGARAIGDRARSAMTGPTQQGLLEDEDFSLDSGQNGLLSSHPVPTSSPSSGAILGGQGAVLSNGARHRGSPEERLVAKICTLGGLRTAPTSEELRLFIEGLTPLSGTTVGQCLQQRLESGQWQEALRALCAIEAALTRGSGAAASGELAVFFQASPQALRRAKNGPHTSVSQRAASVLKLIGEDTLPEGPGAGCSGVQHQASSLDLLGDSEPAVGPSAGTGGSSNPMDLLAGLDQVANAPPASATYMFGDWASGPAQPPIASNTAAAADPLALLGGLSLHDAGNKAPSNTTSSTNVLDPMEGLFGGLSTAPPAAAAAPAPAQTSSFGIDLLDFGAGMGSQTQVPQQSGPGHAPLTMPGIATTTTQYQHKRGTSIGGSIGLLGSQELSASFAVASGVNSAAREDAAFSFVDDALKQLKNK